MERCPRCGKSKNTGEQGRITQWVAGCSCDLEPVMADQGEPLLFCAKCNLRISEKKSGRLTQWIFTSHQCQCEKPEPTAKVALAPPSPAVSQDYRGGASVDSEKELEVDPNAFPLDRYKPLKEIGAGAGGLVYLGRDRLLKKKVAIKCLKTLTAEHLVALQREAKAIGHLQHPNIVTVLDFGAINGQAPYMVLDYVRGTSIADIIAKTGPLSADAAIAVVKQTASGLAHAHNKGIFHRDIKSSNILIVDRSQEDTGGQNLHVKIVDFGLATAKHLDQEPTIMHGRTIVGTPAYMPPDQALGHAYDERSEMYALGCVFFEALTGVPPFVGETALATISMHAHHPTPALHERNSNIRFSAALEQIVAKCLAKIRDERYQTMEELIEALNSMKTRSVMTQEVYKPEMSTTGGFTLPKDSGISDPADRAHKKAQSIASKQGFYGVLIAAAIIGSVAFIVNSSLRNDASLSDDTQRTKRNQSNSTNQNRTVEGKRIASDVNDAIKKLPEESSSAQLLGDSSEAFMNAKRIIHRPDGIVQIDNGDDEMLFKLSNEQKSEKLSLLGGSYTYNGLKEIAKLPVERLHLDNCTLEDPNSDLKFLTELPTLSHLEVSRCEKILPQILDTAGSIKQLKVLELMDMSSNDEQFANINKVTGIDTLSLSMLPNFSGVGLKYLSGMPIKTITMSYLSSLSDAPLAHMRDLSKLSTLGIYHCPDIQGEALNELKDLPLEDLRLVGLPISKHGYSNISKIRKLKHLTTELVPLINSHLSAEHVDIAYMRATFYAYEPGSFKELKNLPNLESAVLNANLFYPEAAEDLAQLPKLKELDLLNKEHITGSTISSLGKIAKLDSLMFFGPGIDSRGWAAIGKLDKLRNLGALRCDLTDEDIESLTKLRLDKLALNSHNLSNKGVAAVAEMKTLKSFEYDCPKVSSLAILRLKKVLPDTNIRRGCTYRNFAPVGFWNIRSD
jgi:serine/threonine protein kinase